MNLTELIQKVYSAIEWVKKGLPSQYINFTTEAGESYTIRVSDHPANNARVDSNTLSFVVEVPEEDEEREQYCSFGKRKKLFRSFPNQFYIDSEGCSEEGYGIEDILDRELF